MERIRHSIEACHPEGDRVSSGCYDVHRIFEPLTCGGPAQVNAATRIGGYFQIDTVGSVAIVCPIDGSDVVSNSLSTCIVVLRLHGAGNCGGGSAEGPFGSKGERCYG